MILEELQRASFPSKTGLYPNELIVLFNADRFKNNEYVEPDSCWFLNQISGFAGDINAILYRLMVGGYLDLESIGETYIRTPIAQVREDVKKLGLGVKSRSKEVLIAAIMQNANREFLDTRFLSRFFKPSLKGQQELADNEYLNYSIWAREYAVVDIWELNKLVNTPPKLPYRDKLWGVMNRKCIEYARQGLYGFVRNTRYHMMDFCRFEGRYSAAFVQACMVMYLDINGVGNSIDYYSPLDTLFNKWEGHYYCPLHSVYPDEIVEALEMSPAKKHEFIHDCCSKVSSPVAVFSKDDFEEMLLAYLRNDTAAVDGIYERVKNKLARS